MGYRTLCSTHCLPIYPCLLIFSLCIRPSILASPPPGRYPNATPYRGSAPAALESQGESRQLIRSVSQSRPQWRDSRRKLFFNFGTHPLTANTPDFGVQFRCWHASPGSTRVMMHLRSHPQSIFPQPFHWMVARMACTHTSLVKRSRSLSHTGLTNGLAWVAHRAGTEGIY